MERVVTYIDGFNLYFGLKDSRWRKFYWLDVESLAGNLLKSGQELLQVKYFTARVTSPADKARRQNTFLEALETLDKVRIFYGKYQLNSRVCRNCGYREFVPSEKMTDVNIAVELLADAYQDRFDTAMLISADSDLVGPIRTVRALFPHKRVVAAFPPRRNSMELQKVVTGYFTIGRAIFAKSIFPEQVTKTDGFVLQRPASWT